MARRDCSAARTDFIGVFGAARASLGVLQGSFHVFPGTSEWDRPFGGVGKLDQKRLVFFIECGQQFPGNIRKFH